MENIKMISVRKIIWVSDKETFEENFKKANKKIVKLGVEPMTFKYFDGSEFDPFNGEDWQHNFWVDYNDDVCGVEITYPTISNISGVECSFVGTVDLEDCSESNKQFHMEEEHFNNIKNLNLTCMHCGKKIARNKYFYFKKNDGEYLALGRSCSKQYFPFSIDSLVKEVEGLVNNPSCFGDPDEMMSRGKNNYVDLGLLFTMSAIATNGFTTWEKKDAYGYGESTTEKIKKMIAELK